MKPSTFSAVKGLVLADPPDQSQWSVLASSAPDGAHEHRERLLTKMATASMLSVSPRQVTRWTSEGKLPCRRLGRRAVRYLESVVLAFICDKVEVNNA